MNNYFKPLKYKNDRFIILDQTVLPGREVWIPLDVLEEFHDAIKTLKVRGAPAIGVAAAYGMAVSMRESDPISIREFAVKFGKNKAFLATARPTAVNLFWALDRMDARMTNEIASMPSEMSDENAVKKLKESLFDEAERIRAEDVAACKAMGEHGLSLLKPGMNILTHCNAGALATAGYGTCLSPIYLGNDRGYDFKVFADETRPLLQGARLTAWELDRAGIDVTLICDNMVSSIMQRGLVDAVLVGCDRMAANGDGANKIGTSGVAILAKEYSIPFYMFAPISTIDPNTPDGSAIPIEDRDGSEIYSLWYKEDMAPKGIKTFNPAFDITNHEYITAIINEKGIVYPPYSFK